ncbi:MAG: fibronectin type III domain-containing protein [Planctomyces sp.]
MKRRIAARRRAAHMSGFTSHLESLEERVYLSRIALAFDAGEKNAPTIAAVGVASSGWSSAFRENLLRSTPELPGGFVQIPADNPVLPWAIDTIAVRFSEDVDVRPGDLTVTAGRKNAYDVLSFAYSRPNLTAVWTISSVTNDWARLNLSNQIQATVTGLFLDGSTAPQSGASDTADITLKSLNADITGDGQVSQADDDRLRDVWFSAVGDERYDHRADLNADGRIDREDRLAVGRNFAARLTSTPPQNTAPDQTVAVSLISIGNLEEDFTAFTVPFAINSSIAPEADLQLSITTSDAGVLPAENLTLAGSGAFRTLTVTPLRDASGQATATLRITEGANFTDVSIPIAIRSINDPPTGHSPPGTIRLTNNEPERTFSLTELFTDPDASVLSYEIVSTDRSLVDVTIQDGAVRLRAVEDARGDCTLRLRATDASGASDTVEVRLEGNWLDLPPLTSLLATITPDQFLAYKSAATIRITTNFSEASRIRVRTENSSVITPGDVRIEHLGGTEFLLHVQHSTNDYGISLVTLEVQGIVFTEFLCVVCPPDNTPNNFESGEVTSVFTATADASQQVQFERVFNDRQIAWLVANRHVDPSTALQIVRPATPYDTALVRANKSGIVRLQNAPGVQGETADRRLQYTVTNSLIAEFREEVQWKDGHVSTSILENALGLYRDQYWNIDAPIVSALNILATGVSVAVMLTPAGPIALTWSAALLLAEIGLPLVKAAAYREARINLSNTSIDNLRHKMNYINATQAFLDALDLKKAITTGMLAIAQGIPSASRTLKALKGLHGTLAEKTIDQLDGILSFQSFRNLLMFDSGSDQEKYLRSLLRERELMEFEFLNKTIEREVKKDLVEQRKVSSIIRNTGQIFDFSEEEILSYEEAALQYENILRRLDATRESIQEQLAEPGKVIVPSRPEESWNNSDPETDYSTIEGKGENGDSLSDAVSASSNGLSGDSPFSEGDILGEYSPHQAVLTASQRWDKLVKSGLAAYDLAKASFGLFATIDDLFDKNAGETGDYTDHDGRTYNINVAQRGDKERFGTASMDIMMGSNLADQLNGLAGNDQINGRKGDDEIHGGEGINTLAGGMGHDRIYDLSGPSVLVGGLGKDLLSGGGGGDMLMGEEDTDQYLFNETMFGHDILLDPSRSGELLLTRYAFSDLQFTRERESLVISAPGGHSSIYFSEFFAQDAAGWSLTDSTGNTYSLYAAGGRLTAYEVIQTVLGVDASGTRVFPAGVQPVRSVRLAANGIEATLAVDRRAVLQGSQARQGYTILLDSVENDGVRGFLRRNRFGGLDTVQTVAAALEMLTPEMRLTAAFVTIIGLGDGGVAAQWAAALLGSQGMANVNVYVVNAPDVSAIIHQAAATPVSELTGSKTLLSPAFSEYGNGFSGVTTNFLFHVDDLPSKIGFFGGKESNWAMARTFSFDPDWKSERVLISEEELQERHRGRVPLDQFDSLVISSAGDVTLDSHAVLRNSLLLYQFPVYSRRSFSDPVGFTTNAARVLADEQDQVITATEFQSLTFADRLAFHMLLMADSQGVREGNAWSVSLDLQAASQDGRHLQPGMDELTENTLYVDGVSPYGWSSTSELKPGEDEGRADQAQRDSVKVRAATLFVDLDQPNAGPGWYNIYISVGSRDAVQESLLVQINGRQVDVIDTLPGDFLVNAYQVFCEEPLLELTFRDRGGKHEYTSINYVSIQKVNYRDGIRPSEVYQDDPPLIVATRDYNLPESSATIEILKTAIIIAASIKLAGFAALAAKFVAAKVAVGVKAAALAVKGPTTAVSTSSTIGTSAAAASTSAFHVALNATVQILEYAGKKYLTKAGTRLINKAVGAPPREQYPLVNIGASMFNAGYNFYQAWKADPVKVDPRATKLEKVLLTAEERLTRATAYVDLFSTQLKMLNALLDGKKKTDFDDVAPWIVSMLAGYGENSANSGLGGLNARFIPVDAAAVYAAIAAGKSNSQILRMWRGSRQVLVLDWTPKHDDILEITPPEHREKVKLYSIVIKRLIEALAEQYESLGKKLDILFVSHGLGYELNREALNRLGSSKFGGSIDYVKFVTLDPIASSYRAFKWYHPELSPYVDSIDNYYSNEQIGIAGSSWLSQKLGRVYLDVVKKTAFDLSYLIVEDLVADDLDFFHGGSVIGGLDSRDGGGSAGFYNRQGRLFDLTTLAEVLRYRHWDQNRVFLASAEMTAIRFSPDGSLVATADMEGQISVRYAHDVRNSVGELMHPAGKIVFSVWGHQSIVRSVEFVELQHNGRTGLYLLSNSSAKDAADASGSRNKILLTDATTGMPVWQGISSGSTQVAASPSGNIIVSTDREGYATIWRRVPDELIYLPDDRLVNAHASSNRNWVSDVIVFNDRFFATSGLDNSLKIFRIDENGATLLQTERFDNVNEGAVRNLDYDPINGLLAVGSGQVVSLWKPDQFTGQLRPLAPASAVSPPRFLIHDHVKDVQGIAFSRPAFLRDAAGRYTGDRSITVNGQQIPIPRTPLGDIDQAAVRQLTIDHKLPAPWMGVVLVTGGEDRTIFQYTLDGLPIGSIRLEQVISGAMLPVKELALSADGRYLALVGDDNTDGSQGGPVRDVDVTDAVDKRIGWAFSELFYAGRREHNAVPEQYVIDVVQGQGESFFWQRNSSNANRPGDLDSARIQSLPPNKRGRLEGVDLEPIVIYPRPGQILEISPLQYVLETDRQHFEIRQDTLVLGNVVDTNNVVIGTMSRKVVKGVEVPDVFIFQASDTLDYSQTGKSRYTGVFRFDIRGPEDIDGKSRLINGAEMTIHVTNHQPVTVRDVVDLHPNRQITDLRPRRNDYDLENDEFSILPFPTAWQTESRDSVGLFRYRRNPDSSSGVDIDVLVDTDTLDALLQADRASGGNGTYLAIELPYTVQETKYRGSAAGVIEVRLQLQSGPGNVRYSEHGADLILIQWDPVSWDATRYVVERWVDDGSSTGSWQRHGTNSEVLGKNASAVRISLDPSKEYYFRVTAINDAFNRPRSSAQTKAEALHVKPVPYTAPDNIQMEALGSTSVEVTWQGVFWKVDRYRIDLFEAIVDAETGVPIRDAAGNYQKDPNRLAGRISVDAALNSRAVFTRLNSGTAYIAEVTALNSNSTVQQTALSRVIAITPERDLPSGVDFVRTGPEQALVSWGTVPWASHYRILALDVHTLARIWSGTVTADNAKNTNTAVIGGLSPVSTYLVTVEARVRKTGEWVRLIDEDPAVAVLPNRDILPDDLAVGLSEDATRTRILPNAFEHTVTLPSLSGLFVGSRLTLLNFSRNNVLFRATDGSIRFAAQSGSELLLKAPFPVNSSDTGPIVLRFTARENPSDLNTLQWHLEPGDAMSEARRLDTPDFQATVDNRLEKSADTKPRRLGVVWESPFWDVKLHKLFLYEFDSSKPGNRGELRSWISVPMSEENTWKLQRTFTELTPATRYMVVMQTFGYDRRFHEIATDMETPAQFSPRDPRADLIRLREFRVRWTSVSDEWNAIGYRVVLEQKINDKWERIRAADKNLEVGASATELLVKGLTPGTHYRFTVEAKTGYDDSWIPNPNVRELSTRQFQLPTADKVWLVSPVQTTRSIGLDWQAAFTIPNTAGFLFGTDTARVFWRAKGSTQPPSQSRLLTDADIVWTIDTDLKRDTEYEVWVEFYAEGVSSPQKLSTKDGVTLKTKAAQPARSVQVPADKILRTSFDMEWQHDDRDDVEGFTLEAYWMGAWRRLAFRNAVGEFVPATNLSRNTRRFTVAWIRNNSGEWVRILPGTTYQLRVITSFDRGTEPLTNTDNPPVSVTTRPNEPPRNVKISDIERWKFRVSWDAPVSGDHSGFTLTASADGGVTFVPVETAGGRIGTDLPASWTTVILSKYRLPNGEYRSFQPGQNYLVRVFATYDDGAQKEPADINGHPVTMAGYVAPKDIVVSQVGLETATVSWTFTDPLGAPDHFVIDVSADDGRTYTKAPVGGTTTNATTRSQTIGGLEPGMTLRARVRSVYGSGDGEASLASAPFTTNPLPIKLNRIVLDGRRAVTPYWTKLEAIPKTLQIQVRRFDPEQSQWLGWEVPVGGNIVEDKTRTSKQITKLWPGSRHELRLAAANSGGNVAYSNTLEFTTEAYPQIADPFTYDPNTTSITAAWTRLETLVSAAVVTDNIVEIFQDGRLLSPPFRTGSGSGPKHSVRLTGLSPGTTYEFRVTAWDETVLLSRSARYEFSTLVDGLNVDEVTAFSARATWTQYAGINATNYRVRALVPGTDTVVSEKLLTIGSGVRSTTMGALQPSTKYEMLVEVLRNSTVLTTSKRVEFTTSSAELTGARLVAVRRFSMDVEWNSVAAWAAWTKVQWRVAGTTTWTGSGTLAATRTSYSVTDLKLTTKYEIRVSAGKDNFERAVILTATTADFVAPSKPDITNVQRTQVTLNWTFSDPAGNPDFFAIWRNGVKVAEVTDVSRRSFTNTGLTAGTNYRFVVRAVYKLGWKDSPESTVTTPAGVAPVITSITNITATNVTVNWRFAGALSEVENFTIHRNNTDQTRLGTLNPASSPTLALPITRDSRAKWFIFVRVRYKDGTVVESALYQLPER